MFAQCTLSLESSNYTFKIKLDDHAIKFFKNNKAKINNHKKLASPDATIDIYEGELIGFAYSNVSSDIMLKELGKWKAFFESNNIKVFDAKILSLKDRLNELNKLSVENRQLIKEIEEL